MEGTRSQHALGEAVARLRRIVEEHDRSGAAEDAFVRGIRESLAVLDAYAEADESSAAA